MLRREIVSNGSSLIGRSIVDNNPGNWTYTLRDERFCHARKVVTFIPNRSDDNVSAVACHFLAVYNYTKRLVADTGKVNSTGPDANVIPRPNCSRKLLEARQ